MDTIIFACETSDEAEKIKETCKGKFKITQITSPEDLGGKLSGVRLIILDQDFSDNNSLDILSNTLKASIIPIIYLSYLNKFIF